MNFAQHYMDVYYSIWASMGDFTKLSIGAGLVGVFSYIIFQFLMYHEDRIARPVAHVFMSTVLATLAVILIYFIVPFIPYVLILAVIIISGWSACMILHLLVKTIKNLFGLTEK